MIDLIYAATIGLLFALGVFQLLRRDLIKAVMGFGVLFTGVNLFFLAAGAFDGVVPPFAENVEKGLQTSDPLVQSLILTAIVVSFGTISMLLAMVNMSSRRYGTIDSDEVNQLKK